MSEGAATAFERGTALLQSGDAAAALPLLREAMHALPGEARAAFRAGTAAFLLRDYAAAAEGFRAAAERDPRWVEAWNNLAASLARVPDHDAAIAAARHSLQIDARRADSWQVLAALLSNRFDRESIAEGLRAIALVLRAEPRSAKAHQVAGLLWRKHGDLERAEQHARQAVAQAPMDAEAVEALGELLLLRDKPVDAIAAYRDARARGVSTPVIGRQLGIALLQAGHASDAAATLSAAVQAAPDDQRAIAHLGVALAAAGDAAAAERLWGVQRNVHEVRLSPPEGFADDDTFRTALAADIRRHSQQRWEPVGLAARQAFLSGDLLADRTPAITGFEQRLRAAIDDFIARCHHDPDDAFLHAIPRDYVLHVWATQAAQSGYIDTHIHEESWLSGAYYVELPDAIRDDDPEHAGWIEFGRPFRGLPAVPEAMLRRIRPEAGTLLLFPSFLFHRTLPYAGAGERISISFDLAVV